LPESVVVVVVVSAAAVAAVVNMAGSSSKLVIKISWLVQFAMSMRAWAR
jgi:type II secretory pathway pseudopilin PulG